MLLVLMFHQIVQQQNTADLTKFQTFLSDLKNHYSFSMPGKKLSPKLNICLTFDDAYFDFYHYIYPLLKTYKVPAVLGVPVNYIQESTQIPTAERLSLDYPQGMAQSKQKHCPLCTWNEIDEMVQSGLVIPASHSLTHPNMNSLKTKALTQEIVESKNVLTERLNYPVDTFIYPYGKGDREVQKQTAQHYKYTMRIGSAVNIIKTWEQNPLIYRINADLWWKPERTIRTAKLLPAIIKYHINTWRNK